MSCQSNDPEGSSLPWEEWPDILQQLSGLDYKVLQLTHSGRARLLEALRVLLQLCEQEEDVNDLADALEELASADSEEDEDDDILTKPRLERECSTL